VRIRLSIPEEHVEPEVINAALEAVTRLDEHMIRSGESPTSHELVASGAKWRPEPPGDEHFDHGKTIAARGWGDCDDWAPLHAATLRASGEDPGASAIVVPSGKNMWHAIVQRSDGSYNDPSADAGMPLPKKKQVIGGGDGFTLDVAACDPHDGRIYRGFLAPTTGPLSMHCGPQVAVRGIQVAGQGKMYQARCDMPLTGSPLVRVRGCLPGNRKQVIGQMPTSFSVTSTMRHPLQALDQAIVGAILCGDAAELVPNLDRYQLIATQMGLAGHKPEEVREALKDLMSHDVSMAESATGIPGHAHVEVLRQQLAAKGVHVTGFRDEPYARIPYHEDEPGVVNGFSFGNIGKICSGIVHSVSKVVNTLGKVPWGDIVHGIEAAVSVIPGLGTVVSEVIATAETAVNAVEAVASGHPVVFAIQAAYNYATATIPGASAIRIVTDPYVNKLVDMARGKLMAESHVINDMLNKLPDKPKIGPLSPRSVVASLAHILIGHMGLKNTSGAPIIITPQARAVALRIAPAGVHMAAARQVWTPATVMMQPHAMKRAGIPHAAVHVDEASRFHARTAANPDSYHSKHWQCDPGPGGDWKCAWSVQGSHVGWNLFHALSHFASSALHTFQHIAEEIGPVGIVLGAALGIPPDPTLLGGVALALMHAHAGNPSAREHLKKLAAKGPKYKSLIKQVHAKLVAHPDFQKFKWSCNPVTAENLKANREQRQSAA